MPWSPKARRQGLFGSRSPASCSRRSSDRQRPPASVRGYDAAWKALRDWYIAQHPCCEHCEAAGLFGVAAREVDHVVPFDGPGDALRLDPTNLQSLCRPCHKRKTDRDAARGA